MSFVVDLLLNYRGFIVERCRLKNRHGTFLQLGGKSMGKLSNPVVTLLGFDMRTIIIRFLLDILPIREMIADSSLLLLCA